MNTINALVQMHNPTIATGNAYTYTYALAVPAKKNKNIFQKLGKDIGMSIAFYRKDETKAASLISYWAVETVLFSIIMLTASSSFVFFSALFLYLYGTYALFSAIMVLL
jgi:hypothetical protein